MNNICTDLYKDFLYFHPTIQDKFINFYKKYLRRYFKDYFLLIKSIIFLHSICQLNSFNLQSQLATVLMKKNI